MCEPPRAKVIYIWEHFYHHQIITNNHQSCKCSVCLFAGWLNLHVCICPNLCIGLNLCHRAEHLHTSVPQWSSFSFPVRLKVSQCQETWAAAREEKQCQTQELLPDQLLPHRGKHQATDRQATDRQADGASTKGLRNTADRIRTLMQHLDTKPLNHLVSTKDLNRQTDSKGAK